MSTFQEQTTLKNDSENMNIDEEFTEDLMKNMQYKIVWTKIEFSTRDPLYVKMKIQNVLLKKMKMGVKIRVLVDRQGKFFGAASATSDALIDSEHEKYIM